MLHEKLFEALEKINHKPRAYQYYTTPELWCDPYISKQMLKLHISDDIELASRKKEFIDRSVHWIIDYFKINAHSNICDFGCGPGLYTTPLAQTGANVTGIDFSKTSIEYAKNRAKSKNLDIKYLLQDYLTFKPDQTFDLLTMIYCDFCVLNPNQRANLLNIFRHCLGGTGFLLLDVSSLALYNAREEETKFEYAEKNGFWSADPYYVFQHTFKYEEDHLLLDKFTIVERSRIRESFNWFQCYSLDTISAELLKNGFEVVECFLNVAGDAYDEKAPELAIVAKPLRSG